MSFGKLTRLPRMLEDPSIQELISWSNNNESFVMTPSTDFSRVLSYVKPHLETYSFPCSLSAGSISNTPTSRLLFVN